MDSPPCLSFSSGASVRKEWETWSGVEGGAGCRTDKQEDGCGMLRRPAVSLSVRQSESRENGGAAVPGMLGGGDDISFSIISGGRPRGKAMQHRRRGEEMERRELRDANMTDKAWVWRFEETQIRHEARLKHKIYMKVEQKLYNETNRRM